MPPDRPRRLTPWPAVAGPLVAALFAASAAMGQLQTPDGGPVVVTPRPQLEFFQLEDLKLALELEWRRDVDEVEPAGGSKRRDAEDRFEEFLDLDSRAFLGHPNLVELNFDGRFGLRQRYFDLEGSPTERVSDTLINYDLSALIFKKTSTPLTVYVRQAETDVNRQFAGDLTDTTSEYGARLLVQSETAPLRIEVFRREQEQVDRANQDEFSLDENTVLLDGQVEMGEAGRLWWDYTFNDITQSGQIRASRSFERHEGNLSHHLEFGPADQHHLRSTLRLYKETGDLDIEQVRLNERLRLRHTDRLQSWIDFNEEHVSRTGSRERFRDLRLTVRHRLFESLITVGEVGGRRVTVPTDDFTSDELFGRLSLDYTKKVPGGRLFAGAEIGRNRTDASDRGSPLLILDNLFTFDPTDLILIDRRNIIASSIVITNAAGTILYSEGTDYTVTAFPDSVEIRRDITGNIAPGETVLIDFEIGPEPGGVTTTDVWGLEARYSIDEGWLRGLSVYTRYRNQDEGRRFEVDDDLFPANDFTSFIYGADYDIWKISLTAEQEIRRSSLSPFERTRFEGRYVDRLGRGNVLILSAQYQEIDRTDENLRSATTILGGELGMELSERLRGNLRLQWRHEDDNAGFESQAFDQELRLYWTYGQTSVYSRIRNSFIDSSRDDTSLQTFVVGLRREF